MTEAEVAALFVDSQVPGLDDPSIEQQTRRTCLHVLGQSHHHAANVYRELERAGIASDDPQLEQSMRSIREGAVHAIAALLG